MCAKNIKISLQAENGVKFSEGQNEQLLGGYPSLSTSWGLQLNQGFLNYGQPRSFLVKLDFPENFEQNKPYLTITLTY